MQNSRRNRVPGGTYFFTARMEDRHSTLLVDEVVRLRHAMRMTKTRYPFAIEAIVVLPSAIHTIWTLPKGDADFSNRWAMLKSRFCEGLAGYEDRTEAQIKRCANAVWQRRCWEHTLSDDDEIEMHREFIHIAPVQAGLVGRPQDWPYSSIHRDIALGRYTPTEQPVSYVVAAPQVSFTPTYGKLAATAGRA